MKKIISVCVLAAFLAASTVMPAVQAIEPVRQNKSITEGGRREGPPDRGGRGGDDWRRRGGGHHGGGRYYRDNDDGWAWAGFGAAVGLGILSAVTQPDVVYVEPQPTYVYPAPTTTYVYPAPTTTYVYPNTAPSSGSYFWQNGILYNADGTPYFGTIYNPDGTVYYSR